jgi:rubredoxin
MGNFRYITNRVLLNNAGKEEGKIAVLVKNDSDDADIKYTCPECKFSEQTKKIWKRPFTMKCSKCGFLIRITKLKDEIKKEKKKAMA